MSDDIIRCPECGRRNRVPAVAAGKPQCGQCHKPLPWIVDATDETFAKTAEGPGVPVLVDFWAPWCGPCRAVAPALEQAARERKGKVKIVKLNVDENPRTSALHQVQSIPTLLLQRGPLLVGRVAGALPKPELDAFIDRYV